MHSKLRGRSSLIASAFAASLIAVLLVALPQRADATLAESDTFEGWTSNVNGEPDFRLVADTDVVQHGSSALRVDYRTPYSSKYVDLRQNVGTSGGTTYDMSAWVRTEDLSSSGSAYFVLSGDHSQRVELPAGTNEWTRLEWTYTQPVGSSTFLARFLVRGEGTVWVDDFRMTAQGSTQNLLVNGSFEEHDPPPGTLAFTDTALVYDVGDAEVGIATIAETVDWRVRASSGQRIDSGTETANGGTAAIDLSNFPAGYYSVTMSIDAPVAVTRTASLAIVERAQPGASTHQPVGLAVHVNRYSVDQVDALMDPLEAGMLREGPPWDLIETAPGEYEFPAHFDAQIEAAKERGERPLVILAYFSRLYDDGKTPSSEEGIAAYAAYAAAAAEHYGPDVDYEIYNEFNHKFNNGACGMTADCYFDLLAPAADAIHEAAPGARVVGPVIAGADWDFMDRLFELGGLNYLDVVSYHTYDFPVAPEGRTEAGVATLRSLIDSYAPGADIPIWLTEHGWTTTTGGTTEREQAAYIVRSAALLEDAGVDRTVYYELIDSGTNPVEQEHNFGIARLPVDGGSALTPKPAFPALSTYNRMVAGHQLVDLTRSDDSIAARFENENGAPLYMVWATNGPATLEFEIGSSGRLTKGDGRSWRVRPDGPLQVTIGDEPVFVNGAVSGPVAVTDPAAVLDTPDEIPVDGGPDVDVTIDREQLEVVGDVDVVGPVGAGTTLDGSGAIVTGAITLAPMREVGERPVGYTVRKNDGVVAFVADTTQVVENPVVALQPTVDASAEVRPSVVVENLPGAQPVNVEGGSWRISQDEGTFVGSTVAPGESATFGLDAGSLEPWTAYDYTLDVTIDGEARTQEGSTALAPIPADPADAIDVGFHERGRYVPLEGGVPGHDDLSGTFAVSWEPAGLRVRADITDEEHATGSSVGRLWAGDSIQFAVARGLPGQYPQSRAEIGVYDGAEDGSVYRYTSPVGVVDAHADVTRQGTTTSYDVLLPWAEVGLDPDAQHFSFSILVNDKDNGSREGFYEWGSGIGSGKNASLFLPVVPVREAPTASQILVDGIPIADFDPEQLEYTAEALAGGPVPYISATAKEPAMVEVTQADSAPGEATAVVSQEGRPSTTYTVTIDVLHGDDAEIDATVKGKCRDGEALWRVKVRNSGDFVSDIDVSSSFDAAETTRIAPGKKEKIELFSDSRTVRPGTVDIIATVPYQAPDRPESTIHVELSAPEVDCRGGK